LISQHLKKLKDAGLVKENRKEQWIFYSVNHNSQQNDLTQSLISRVPSQTHQIKKLEQKGLRISCEY